MNASPDDAELCRLAASGNNDAMARLWSRFDRLGRRIAAHYSREFNLPADMDDLYSLAMSRLTPVSKSYRPERGSLTNYFAFAATRVVIRHCRRLAARLDRRRDYPLDIITQHHPFELPDEQDEILRAAVPDPLDRYILVAVTGLTAAPRPLRRLARALGITQRQASERYRRAKSQVAHYLRDSR